MTTIQVMILNDKLQTLSRSHLYKRPFIATCFGKFAISKASKLQFSSLFDQAQTPVPLCTYIRSIAASGFSSHYLLLAITFELGNLSVRFGLIDQASFVASMILVFARMQLPVGCPELIRDWIANEKAKPLAAWGAATYSPSAVDKTLY
jgi:hypothetical protein